MLYRIRQFVQAVRAKIDEEEIELIKCYLSEDEQELFFKLLVHEQKHCVLVAKGLKEACDNQKKQSELIRLGLLHDIGKIKYPLSPIEKGIIVILDRLTKGKISKFKDVKMVKCYYEHASASYEMLNQIGIYEERFLNIIRDHHNPHIEGDENLRLLKKYDDMA